MDYAALAAPVALILAVVIVLAVLIGLVMARTSKWSHPPFYEDHLPDDSELSERERAIKAELIEWSRPMELN